MMAGIGTLVDLLKEIFQLTIDLELDPLRTLDLLRSIELDHKIWVALNKVVGILKCEKIMPSHCSTFFGGIQVKDKEFFYSINIDNYGRL